MRRVGVGVRVYVCMCLCVCFGVKGWRVKLAVCVACVSEGLRFCQTVSPVPNTNAQSTLARRFFFVCPLAPLSPSAAASCGEVKFLRNKAGMKTNNGKCQQLCCTSHSNIAGSPTHSSRSASPIRKRKGTFAGTHTHVMLLGGTLDRPRVTPRAVAPSINRNDC